MPISRANVDPLLLRLPAALQARMAELGHNQMEAAKAAGVSQSDVSRALNGQRKRLTEPMRRLCQYANVHADTAPDAEHSIAELSQLLRRVIGDNPHAAPQLSAVLHSLAPLLATYHPSTSTASGAHP